MDHVHQFIKTWNKSQQEGQDIEMFLDKRIDLPNPTMIRDHLATLPDQDREEVRKQLIVILGKIQVHAEGLTQGLADIEEQMAKARSAQDMCVSYEKMNEMAAEVAIGSDGLSILPFGNGAERVLENKNPGATLAGINFNIHSQAHLFRAAQEGIVFSFKYGMAGRL